MMKKIMSMKLLRRGENSVLRFPFSVDD